MKKRNEKNRKGREPDSLFYIRMFLQILFALCVPFLGTVCGAACVFFTKRREKSCNAAPARCNMIGAAAGVMTAAAFFSLLIPALSEPCGLWKASLGFAAGILLLSCIDRRFSVTHDGKSGSFLAVLAIVLHNIPEGMAVGTALAANSLSDGETVRLLAITSAVAIQNFPDGAIVSIPLCFSGVKKPRAFFLGVLSGAVEPIFALLTRFLAGYFTGVMPILLAFAAGSMLYVVVTELISEMKGERTSGMSGFTFGFLLMMILDTVLAG